MKKIWMMAIILLLDEKGELRKKLKVKKEATVVLTYDNDGKLVNAVNNQPTKPAAHKAVEAVDN